MFRRDGLKRTRRVGSLEADAARLSVAIHCIKECDPGSFSFFANKDGRQQQSEVLAMVVAAKQNMEKKTRSLIRESLQ